MARAKRWDVFCSVVDNFGDAGVAWRLARILAVEHRLDVTLWIDALAPLSRIAPAIVPDRDVQRVDGVTVRTIAALRSPIEPADVVVEAFAGGLPDPYVDAMAERDPPPKWLRLEYLALESAFDTHHGLPSPHPRLPLARVFWFPGFSPRTGGLLRERRLLEARDAFAGDAKAERALWASLGVVPRARPELRVSMFCYPDAPLDALLDVWSRNDDPVTCIVAEGIGVNAIERFARRAPPRPHEAPLAIGHLTLAVVPFVAQEVYDRVLWACDVNFVRGEDSFVRAQWAAKPFVWQAYAQAERAHATKVSAFVERYAEGLDARTAAAVRGIFDAWNAPAGAAAIDPAWRAFAEALDALRAFAPRWAAYLATLPEVADGLVKATENAL